MAGDDEHIHRSGSAAPAAFFARARALWRRASDRGGGVETRRFAIGGHRVALAIAGTALVDALWPLLAHLADDDGNPSLTVLAWDGLDLAPLRLAAGAWPQRGGLIPELTGGATSVSVNLGADALTGLDRDERVGLYWTAAADALPWWERAAPLRTLLGWAVADAGQQLAHAGAVCHAGRAVLLVGRAGSGKSTATLACLADPELGLIGDDFVLVEESPLRVSPVYGAAKIEPEHLAERLPWLAPHVLNPDADRTEKRVVAWALGFAERLRTRVPVAALVVPRVVDSDRVEVRRTSRARALIELAPTTLFQLPGTTRATFGRLGDWARNLPAYELRLGRDLGAVPAVIKGLLRELAAAEESA